VRGRLPVAIVAVATLGVVVLGLEYWVFAWHVRTLLAPSFTSPYDQLATYFAVYQADPAVRTLGLEDSG
jgi:hypothetical protein